MAITTNRRTVFAPATTAPDGMLVHPYRQRKGNGVGELLIGRYELVDVLDVGGAGIVWRAWDHRDGRYVAAKMLKQSGQDAILRFVQESTRIIDHPHIVLARDWFAHDDMLVCTMDLIPGGSVATLLADYGRLPEGWVTELAHQTAKALAAVHAAGCAHRDVKPANLLLDATGRNRPHLRLSDFGSAAAFNGPRLTMPTTVVGTPGYLSPEAAQGAEPAVPQDIYALGMTIREMATGTPPDQPLPPAAPKAISRGLAALITAMTAPNPADRPPSAAQVADHLTTLSGANRLDYGADHNDPLEIYNQLAPPPRGWTRAGPQQPAGHSQPGASADAALTDQPLAPRPPTSEAIAAYQQSVPLRRLGAGLGANKVAAALIAAGLVLVALAVRLA